MNLKDIADFLDLVSNPEKYKKYLNELVAEQERFNKVIATVGEATELGNLRKEFETAQGGSYALSGGIARILKSKRITSVGGVYTLTGSDVVVLKSKYLTAASGTYSLTGGTATVLKSKVLISTGGVYSYTGSSTVIKKSKYLSALGGSYSLLGSSVVLVHGGIGGIVWPPTHLVVLGTVYGPTGSEYTGTLDVNGIKYDITTGQLVKPISDKVVMSL